MIGDGLLRAAGRGVVGQLEHTAGMFALLGRALRNLGALASRPVRTVFYRQVYFTGLQALARTGSIGALIGVIVLTQVASLVGKNAALGGQILVWMVIRELGPLFAAIIVISRSSSAVAAELGSMRVNREMELLRGLGISPLRYLVVPRVAGVAASLVALTAWFEAVTIAGGLAFSSLNRAAALPRAAAEHRRGPLRGGHRGLAAQERALRPRGRRDRLLPRAARRGIDHRDPPGHDAGRDAEPHARGRRERAADGGVHHVIELRAVTIGGFREASLALRPGERCRLLLASEADVTLFLRLLVGPCGRSRERWPSSARTLRDRARRGRSRCWPASASSGPAGAS